MKSEEVIEKLNALNREVGELQMKIKFLERVLFGTTGTVAAELAVHLQSGILG